MKINAVWHAAHRMPINASIAQRIKWHMSHAKACACRPMPAKLKEELTKQANPLFQISQPAQRALKSVSISKLEHFKKFTEKEIVTLHGMGPKALGIIKKALRTQRISFKSS
jgi:hypothetical protein